MTTSSHKEKEKVRQMVTKMPLSLFSMLQLPSGLKKKKNKETWRGWLVDWLIGWLGFMAYQPLISRTYHENSRDWTIVVGHTAEYQAHRKWSFDALNQ